MKKKKTTKTTTAAVLTEIAPSPDTQQAEPAAVPMTPGPGKSAAVLGAVAVRYLKIHARKPYQKAEELQWIVDRAREAWRQAVRELSPALFEGDPFEFDPVANDAAQAARNKATRA